MQVTEKKLPQCVVELTIELNEEDIQKAKDKTLNEASKHVKIPGFRKGNIPKDVLIQNLNQNFLVEETQKHAVSSAFKKAVKDVTYTIITEPKLNVVNKSPFTFTVTFEIEPEITLDNYKDIKITIKEEEPTKKEEEDIMKLLQEQLAQWQDVDRKAKEGDNVQVDFEGFDKEKKAVSNSKVEGHWVVLGNKQFVDDLEKGIAGMKAEEEKEVKVTFPQEYHVKDMAGNTYTFQVKLHKVQEKVLPEVNEEFVEKITGKKDSVESLKEEIRKNLKHKKHSEAHEKSENEVLEKLSGLTEFELPESMVSREQNFIIDNIKMGALEQGLPWEKYQEVTGKSEEALRFEVREEAEKRVKSRLIIQQIIKLENITANEEDIEAQSAYIFSRVPNDRKEKLRSSYQKGGKHYEQLRSQILVSKVFDMFIEGHPHH